MTLTQAVDEASKYISDCGTFKSKIDYYKVKGIPRDRVVRRDCQDNETIKGWETVGTNLLQQKKVAVIMLAGGDGTRLGHYGPKGTFKMDLTPPRSIFELILSRLAKVSPITPLYIMTNKATHASIEGFFDTNDYFGMDPDVVHFIQQGMAPCLNEGRTNPIVRAPGVMAEAPNGNGGLHLLLRKLRLVDEFHRQGIEYISVIPVDNVLAHPADPVMLGAAASMDLDVMTKVLERYPGEKVGVATMRNDRPTVVEYTDIPEDMQNTDEFTFGVAGIHVFSVRFMRRILRPEILDSLPVHYAHKCIPEWDEEKQRSVVPKQPNGWKQEYFIFDVFPAVDLERYACLLIKRDDEFAVVKNKTGSDSAVSALMALRSKGIM